MTIGEKRAAIRRHCQGRSCDDCKLYNFVGTGSCCERTTDAEIEKNYAFLLGKTPEETASTIDHPSHYAGGKYECIEVMREVFGEEAVKNFCICNAFKYLWRHRNKEGEISIDKALWYLKKYVELRCNGDEER